MIKLFLCDCDGTLTNGVYIMGENGEFFKEFFSRDFHGMWMLNQTGLRVGIISYSSDDVIVKQCNRCAKYVDLMIGAKDKVITVRDKYINTGFCDWENIAYIGDDVVDIELLKMVGLPACPQNADFTVKQMINRISDGFISQYSGGNGAVREFADYVRELNGEKS